jgi:hypothetical protein
VNAGTAAEIPFCDPDTDTEYPDLNDAVGDYVLFLWNTGRCFSLVAGYTAVVAISNGRAVTSGIDDQPAEQPAGMFVKKNQSLMGTHRLIMVYPVRPCPEATKKTGPVTRECVAAAVAERAFLEETHHDIAAYTIFAMQQTEAIWYFDIALGDERHPSPPGGHYMVAVDRATRKTELIPGK